MATDEEIKFFIRFLKDYKIYNYFIECLENNLNKLGHKYNALNYLKNRTDLKVCDFLHSSSIFTTWYTHEKGEDFWRLHSRVLELMFYAKFHVATRDIRFFNEFKMHIKRDGTLKMKKDCGLI